MRRTRLGCCACTASGQAALAPPRRAMTSRRLMGYPLRSPARKQLVEEGFEAVLSRKPRAMPAVARIFDGEKEAKLIALACSKPPKGRARWTLRLLENKVVELGIVDRASDSTIGRALKKTLFSPIGRTHEQPAPLAGQATEIICNILYSISHTVSDLDNIYDRSIRAFAVEPRAFGAPLSGFGLDCSARPSKLLPVPRRHPTTGCTLLRTMSEQVECWFFSNH